MKHVNTRLEELSGLISFLVGLLCLFVAASIAFYIRNPRDWIFVAVAGVWGVTLLIGSRRGGRGLVVFRIVSVLVLVIGTIAAAVLLPPLH